MKEGFRPPPETREFSSKAKRFVELSMLVVAMMGSPKAEARDYSTAGSNSDWAQLVGKNVGERQEEIAQLKQRLDSAQRKVEAQERKIVSNEERGEYNVRLGLKGDDKAELRSLEAERDHVARLLSGLERETQKGIDAYNDRREKNSNTWADLSPDKIGREEAQYMRDYHVEFHDHVLSCDVGDGTRIEQRIGPELLPYPHFLLKNNGTELRIVFDTTDGTFKTLALDHGVFGDFYQSNDEGNPISIHK